ncbi:MAG: SgcJ/EcaC family oxidoreductase, partial [Candidatus Eremiobacteraeota bacterium]|nr:SgcJ/EcaC family oxidoreductase [Candidatus Eremiobacteraeota bacterium]
MGPLNGVPVYAADRATDESAIRDLVGVRQQDAWNKHDAHAYADLFAEDGDVVNVVAWWWKGRAEIESNLTRMFASIFRESTLTFTEVDVRFLTPDIAIAHARWRMTGAQMPPGLPEPREGLQ